MSINKTFLSITLSVLSPFITVAQNSDYYQNRSEGDSVVWAGINAFYNFEYTKAVEILSKARNDYPLHPTVHFVWATSEWLNALAYEGVEESYTILNTDLNEIIEEYVKLIKRFPDNQQYELYLGAAHGLKARIHLGKKEWLGVLYQGYIGYKIVMNVYKQNPDMGDAVLPIGILNFYIGSSPKVVRYFSKLIGIKGDRKLGIEQIKTASEKGEYSWIEADAILAFIYLWMDEEYDLALPVTIKLRDNFPGSFYFQHIYTENLIRLNRLDEAEANLEIMDKMLDKLPPKSKQGWIPTHNYQKALLQFYKRDYDIAMKLVNSAIEDQNTEMDTNLAFAYLLRGKLYDLKGDRDLAIADYSSARKLDNYTFAVREAEMHLITPFNDGH